VQRTLTNAALATAARVLARKDRDLGAIVASIGTPPMWGRRPGFATLVRIILEQQVSLAAARSLYLRIEREMGGMSPEIVRARGEHGLRALGVTRQ